MTPNPVTLSVPLGSNGQPTAIDYAVLRAQLAARLHATARSAVAARTVTVDQANATYRSELDRALARIDELERRSRVGLVPGSAEGRPGTSDEFQITRVFRSLLAGGRRELAPAEWEMSDAAWRDHQSAVSSGLVRAQSTVDDQLGGFMVPNQVMNNMFVPLLRPAVSLYRLGVLDLPADGIPVEIPKEKTRATTSAVAENAATPETHERWGKLQIFPFTASSFIKSPERFLAMTGAEGMLRRIMATEIAQTIDRWGYYGQGGEDEPPGLLSTMAIGSVSFSGVAADSYAVLPKLWRMRYALAANNTLAASTQLGWAMSEDVLLALHLLKSENPSAGTEKGEVNRKVFTSGAESNVLNYPFASTTQLTAGTLVLGDWPQYVIARWGNVVLRASNQNEDAMRRRQVHIIAYQDVGNGALRENAFVQATNYNTSALLS